MTWGEIGRQIMIVTHSQQADSQQLLACQVALTMTGRVSNGSESIKSKHMPWTPQEKHFWNGKIRTSKNLLLHEASLVVQWLSLWASTAAGTDLIPGWGTKILHVQHGQKKKQQQHSSKKEWEHWQKSWKSTHSELWILNKRLQSFFGYIYIYARKRAESQ